MISPQNRPSGTSRQPQALRLLIEREMPRLHEGLPELSNFEHCVALIFDLFSAGVGRSTARFIGFIVTPPHSRKLEAQDQNAFNHLYVRQPTHKNFPWLGNVAEKLRIQLALPEERNSQMVRSRTYRESRDIFFWTTERIGLGLGARATPIPVIESPARRSYRAGLLGACSLVEIVDHAAVRWIHKMHASVSVIVAVSAH